MFWLRLIILKILYEVRNVLRIILISILCLSACSSDPSPAALQKGVHISLSADSSSVELHLVQPDVLEYLKEDSLSKKEWNGLFAVYRDPKDPELRDLQLPLKGNYLVKDSVIVFLPLEGFERDSGYFARFYSPKTLVKPSDAIAEGNLARKPEIVEFNFIR